MSNNTPRHGHCPGCPIGGCPDKLKADHSETPFICPDSGRWIYYHLPEGMLNAKTDDFFDADGVPRVNMPFLLEGYNLYYAFKVDASFARSEIRALAENNLVYIKQDHQMPEQLTQ